MELLVLFLRSNGVTSNTSLMEFIDIKIPKEESTSEICYLKPVSENSHLIIKSNIDIKDETYLNFKSANGKEVKNILNRNGLNRRIYIPEWVGMVYFESVTKSKDILFNVCVEY